MSFRYIVVCNRCSRQQGVLTPDHPELRNDGGGILVEELEQIGWVAEEDGRHTCPFCTNPCPDCGGDGEVDIERGGTSITCPTCGGKGIAPAKKEKGEN